MSRSRPPRPSWFTPAEALETRRLLAAGPDRLVNDNAGATATSNFTQREPGMVAFGSTVVVGFDDSGSVVGGTNHFNGWARSTDGGATFTDGGTLPNSPGGDAGDSQLARDATTGRIYFSAIGFSASTLQVFRSDTGGASWLAPVNGTPGGNSEDRHRLAVDNFAGPGRGNVYLASRRFGGAPGNYLFRSTNGGDSFGPSGGTLISTDASIANAPFVAVGPDHAVYVFWYQTGQILVRKSTDLGVTFGPSTLVASVVAGGVNGDLGLVGIRNGTTTPASFRTDKFPRVAVNPVNGNLYVAYADDPAGGDKADIFLVQSTNGGASWSAPVRVNDDATPTDQWQPTVAVTPDGTKLGVFYYSRQEEGAANNRYRYYGRLAALSGPSITFTPSFAVSDVDSPPEFGRDNVVNAVYMSDNDAAVATSDAFHVAWSDSRSPHPLPAGSPRMDPNVYYDRIPLAPAPAVTASGFHFATLPQRLTFTFNQNVGASLGLDDLVVSNVVNGSMVTPSSFAYNAATNTATFSFNAPPPDGRYSARLLGGGISGPGGNLPADHAFEFTFLRGDADGDGRVNLNDFNILAANFGQAPRNFTQGDFDYSGNVNLSDFNLLAARFGMTVAPAASPAGGDDDNDDDQSDDREGVGLA
jgi:hypothetical protein